jgi:nitrate reductase NapAB chaperone NapD
VPIKSYIAWPSPGRAAELESSLLQIPGCEVISAENRELLLLVTDTPTESAEDALCRQLEQIEDLQCLSLVSGVTEKEAA